MKPVFIGTSIPADDHKSLKIIAAMEGESVSSLLKRLAMDFVAAKKPAKRRRAQTNTNHV